MCVTEIGTSVAEPGQNSRVSLPMTASQFGTLSGGEKHGIFGVPAEPTRWFGPFFPLYDHFITIARDNLILPARPFNGMEVSCFLNFTGPKTLSCLAMLDACPSRALLGL